MSETRREYSNHFKQAGLSFRLVFNYFFVLFLGSMFAWQQSFAAVHTAPHSYLRASEFIVSFTDNSFSSHQIPHHFPFKSTPAPQEQESLDEDNLEDFDDDSDSSSAIHTTENTLTYSFTGTTFIQISQAEQNCVAVPLFILYHSWKSYLS